MGRYLYRVWFRMCFAKLRCIGVFDEIKCYSSKKQKQKKNTQSLAFSAFPEFLDFCYYFSPY
jgi:hypothetical protein